MWSGSQWEIDLEQAVLSIKTSEKKRVDVEGDCPGMEKLTWNNL